MNTFMSTDVPKFVEKELEQIKERVAPLMKKSSVCMFFSMFLLMISITNLYFILFHTILDVHSFIIILLFSLCGAFGLALYKESKMFHKEIQRVGNQHIIERINNSLYLTDSRKKEYIGWVNEQPFIATNTFIEFLNEEDNKRKRLLRKP